MDVLVVGAGFSGAVAARVLADRGYRVVVVEKRSHVGGNAWDSYDEHGILVHPYGPHIFHTNSERVFNWLSRFTDWRLYEDQVLARIDGRLYPIPINLITVNMVFGLNLKESEMPGFLETLREPRELIRSSEDVLLNSVGRQLCDMFFRGYTKKQWGKDLSELAPSVAARVPYRTNDDSRYFLDKFQFMPKDGYAALFARMLDHPNISVRLNFDYLGRRDAIGAKHTIYTGPIDAFFDFRYGRLEYRSLRFEHYHLADVEETDYVQAAPVINFPADNDYTRITEFKQLTAQRCRGSSLVKEYPMADGDPYYPVPSPANESLLRKYQDHAESLKNIHFVGRLAQYRYYNMDQAVAASIKATEEVEIRIA